MAFNVMVEAKHINLEKKVEVVLVVECGSRCWGLQDADSDHDVHFVYVRPRRDYVTLFKRKDVIDWTHTDELEMSGFDISKLLTLLSASNPTVLEWLHSPIVYFEHPCMQPVRDLAESCVNPVALAWHYHGMATNHDIRYLRKGRVTPKRYLFALRGLMACEWAVEMQTMPPMAFDELRERFLEPKIYRIVDDLVEKKRSGHGRDEISPIGELDEWISAQETSLKEKMSSMTPPKRPDKAVFDDVFRRVIGF